MNDSVRLPRPAVYALQVATLATVYYAAARFGLRYATIGQNVSLIWPPTGLAIAALVILGRGAWPGIAVGTFFANAATAIPLGAAAGIAVGNTLEAVIGATLLVRAAGSRPRFDSMGAVRALILMVAPLSAQVSAFIGVGTLVMAGALPAAGAVTAVAFWWTGNVLGALIVTPLLLAWLLHPTPRLAVRGPLEVVLLCLGTVVAAEMGLGRFLPAPAPIRMLDYLYLLFPFVIWAALRFGSRGASLVTFVIAVIAVWRTVTGGGPFNSTSGGVTLLGVGCYLGVVAVTGLLLAAAVSNERETATDEIRRREEQLRLSLDAARMGVWFWSAKDNTLTWDDTLRQMYGLGPDDRVSGYEDFIARVHPDDRESVESSVRRALADGGRLDYEFRILLPDGRVRWVADLGRVVPGKDGAAVGMTGTCQDVTDRRTAEEQLRLAHKMESVGRLAGGVAHETNNQMSVVMSAADFILARADLPTSVRADAEYIRRAAERTAAVTAQLLAFSRRQVMRTRVLDLNAVLERFRPVLQRTLGEDCQVTLLLDPALGRVRADLGQLEQVLLNLTINARDAMPRGGTLSVETSTALLTERSAVMSHGLAVKPGRYALMSVSDTGNGMDKATLAQIFEPFFTTKAVGQGTGLGLATVYGIVKQSGGYVWAYSEPGGGTTIKIYLPLTDAPGEPAAEEAPARPAATGELILVVEDEAPVRAIAARALVEAGYRVLEADRGQRALELLRRSGERPALVLADVVMPGLSASELAAELARVAPGVPVLYTSGYTDSEILRRGLLEEGAPFLPKPFSPEALVKAVRMWVGTA